MRLETGKTYRTRDGRKVGPMGQTEWSGGKELIAGPDSFGSRRLWWIDGRGNAGRDTPEDLIAEWTDGPVFTVGARVRRIASPHSFVPIGYETDIKAIDGNTLSYRDADGDLMHSPVEYWELVERTDGPVRTVTRREVVPGVYSYVSVMEKSRAEASAVAHVAIVPHHFSADELRAAAAVLLELAGALDSE